MGFPSDWCGLAAGKMLPLITDGGLSNHGVREAPGRLGIKYLVSDTLHVRVAKHRAHLAHRTWLDLQDCPSAPFIRRTTLWVGGARRLPLRASPLWQLEPDLSSLVCSGLTPQS